MLPGRPHLPHVPVALQGVHGGQRPVRPARRHPRRQGRRDAQVRREWTSQSHDSANRTFLEEIESSGRPIWKFS